MGGGTQGNRRIHRGTLWFPGRLHGTVHPEADALTVWRLLGFYRCSFLKFACIERRVNVDEVNAPAADRVENIEVIGIDNSTAHCASIQKPVGRAVPTVPCCPTTMRTTDPPVWFFGCATFFAGCGTLCDCSCLGSFCDTGFLYSRVRLWDSEPIWEDWCTVRSELSEVVLDIGAGNTEVERDIRRTEVEFIVEVPDTVHPHECLPSSTAPAPSFRFARIDASTHTHQLEERFWIGGEHRAPTRK